MTDLIVIIGSGASHGCYLKGHASTADSKFRPPLTRDLFSPERNFEAIREAYPGVIAAASAFTRRTEANSELTLEGFLRELSEKSGEEYVRQLKTIQLYLADLFLQVSHNYLGGSGSGLKVPSAYHALVSEMMKLHEKGVFERVCLVTLNYDLLLDAAIEANFSTKFENAEDYLSFKPSWSFVKYHGSASWWKPWKHGMNIPTRELKDRWLWLIQRSVSMESLSEEIQVHNTLPQPRFPNPSYPQSVNPDAIDFFPILTIPVEGKSDVACPEAHRKQLRSFKESNEIALVVIGYSAKDADLFGDISEFLPKVQKIHVVDTKDLVCREIWGRFLEKGLPRSAVVRNFTNLFTGYLLKDKGLSKLAKI